MFHLLFERTADAVWLFDPATALVVDCNQAAVQLLRCQNKTGLIGKRFEDLGPSHQPCGRLTCECVTERIEETLKNTNSRFEWVASRSDGSVVPLEVTVTMIEREGKPLFVLISRDISERKAAEAALRESECRFRALFEQSADAMSIFDPVKGVFIDSNEAVVRQTRASSREALGHASPTEISPERQPDGQLSKEKAQEMVGLALRKGSHRFEWLSRRYDGSDLPLDVVMTRIPFGERPLLFVVSRDITDRKQVEREILELNASLEQRVGERTVELVQANEQLKSEIAERRRQEKIQRATYQISEAAHTADDLPSFYARVHAIIGTLMPAQNFYIALLDPKTELISFPYFVDQLAESSPEPRPVQTGLTGVVFRTGKPLLVDRSMASRARREGDTLKLEGVDVPYVEAGRQAAVWLGAPLMFQGRAFGVMALQDYTNETAYRESEKQILTFVSEQTALAITRKRAEQALRDSEEQHRALFEATSQGVMLHDDKAFFLVNPAALRILGYKNAEGLVGKHPADISVPVQPGGEDSMSAAKRHIADCLRDGSTRFDWLSLRADGTEILMDVLLTAIQLGERKIIQAVVDDITERRQAEQAMKESEALLRESEARFSTAFRASPALITISRLNDPRFVEVNDAFVKWLGLERHQILGRSSQDLGIWEQPGDRGEFLKELQQKGSVRDVEQRMRTKRGTVHTLSLSADIIEIGREPHVLVFGLDITERKQAEAELLKTLAREKELGQLRSKFVSMVSHEFRTPLGIIQSSAEILQDYLDSLEEAERKEHLQSIQKNTRRMAGLMEEVLLIGSLDAGKMDFRPEPLALGGFLRKLVEEVSSANGRRCPIHLCLGEAGPEVQADERLLRHIFTNLLTNAMKYSEDGRAVQFEVKQDGPDLVYEVRDHGIGIPEADREWLFHAFHRGANVGNRPGTGLGLVIVKRCVDLHGGTIHVESQVGNGTVVSVRLPIATGSNPS